MHLANILRWAARLGSIASLAFIAPFAFGGREPGVPNADEMVGLSFFPVGVLVGLILAWRFELLGGLFATVNLALFYGWCYLHSGRLPSGPYFALLTSPALLFLLANIFSRRQGKVLLPGSTPGTDPLVV